MIQTPCPLGDLGSLPTFWYREVPVKDLPPFVPKVERETRVGNPRAALIGLLLAAGRPSPPSPWPLSLILQIKPTLQRTEPQNHVSRPIIWLAL